MSTLFVLVSLVVSRFSGQSVETTAPGSVSGRRRPRRGIRRLLRVRVLRIHRTSRRLGRVLRTVAANALNTFVFVVSRGERTPHQGRLWQRRGKWRWTNWNRSLSGGTREVFRPTAESELCAKLQQELRRNPSLKVRVVGSGHSFNRSPLSRDLMVSLEQYRLEPSRSRRLDAEGRVEWLEEEKGTRCVRVAAGMRLRDLTRTLWRKGWSLPMTGSTDAQSLAGLMATDVHGTGLKHGFISEQVRSVRIVDSTGAAKTFTRDSTAFRAAIGGLGTCGIITEVVLECEPAFTLEKSSWLVLRSQVDANLARIVQEHDHVSFYELGGIESDHIRMNVWERSIRAPSAQLRRRNLVSELLDMFASGFLFEGAVLLSYRKKAEYAVKTGRLTNLVLSFFKRTMDGRYSVHPAATGFTRTLFFRHEELEYCLPLENYRACMEELRPLLLKRKFLTVIETRVAPANRTPSLLGPGAVSVGAGPEPRMVAFIDLNPSVSYGPRRIRRVFQEAAKILQRHGGLPHLGKQVPDLREHQAPVLSTLTTGPSPYGERLAEFQKARDGLDPEKPHPTSAGGTLMHRMFANEFTDRVIGR